MSERSLDGARCAVIGGGGALENAIVRAFGGAGATVSLVTLGRADPELPDPLDVVAFVVGHSDAIPLGARTGEAWASAIADGIERPIRVLTGAATRMARSGGGAIVVVGTMDAAHAYAGRADASVAMGGLLGLIRSMAVELAGDGIRANAVLAGPLEERAAASEADQRARTVLRSPAGRLTSAAEVAAAVVFVTGPAAAFMTGATLRVDGGWGSLNQAPDGMRFR